MARRPQVGRVKTRLAAGSSPEWAAQVAEAFLRDMVARLATFPARRILLFSPAEAQGYFHGLGQKHFTLMLQHDGDLGGRMKAFFAELCSAGAERIVLVGADSPTVPLAYIAQAFQELEQADIVLGPATDGGYYLVGCGRRLPPIFDGVAWGSPGVLQATIARLADPGWRLALLPPWYDVDTVADWRMLQGHLAAMRRAGIDPGLTHVEQLDEPLDGMTGMKR